MSYYTKAKVLWRVFRSTLIVIGPQVVFLVAVAIMILSLILGRGACKKETIQESQKPAQIVVHSHKVVAVTQGKKITIKKSSVAKVKICKKTPMGITRRLIRRITTDTIQVPEFGQEILISRAGLCFTPEIFMAPGGVGVGVKLFYLRRLLFGVGVVKPHKIPIGMITIDREIYKNLMIGVGISQRGACLKLGIHF